MPRNRGSYIGHVESDLGVYLLGGVRHVASSRFATKQQAQHWIDVVELHNEKAGRTVASTWIEPSRKNPEIDAERAA